MRVLEEKIKIEIKRIIEEERAKDDGFTFLDGDMEDHLNLIFEILNSEKHSGNIDFENFREFDQIIPRKKAELIFVAAPTGAGKDTLVVKIAHDNPDKKYVVLNMDMFRTYFPVFIDKIIDDLKKRLNDRDLARQTIELNDRNFAQLTNGFSYEIYYTIQRLLLENFPGTNIIITGTIRETGWVEKTLRSFKSNPYTQYTNKMFALAVPKNVCAYSANYRYVKLTEINEEGTSRYVDMEYYNDTIQNFPTNLRYFEGMLDTGLLDVVRVYRRSREQYDFREDTLLYESSTLQRKSDITSDVIVRKVMNCRVDIEMEIKALLDIVESRKEYFIKQGVYEELTKFIKSLEGNDISPQTDTKQNIGVMPESTEGKHPGSDD